MYRKETIPVKIGDKVIDGMVYIMNDGQISPPPESYYTGILKDMWTTDWIHRI